MADVRGVGEVAEVIAKSGRGRRDGRSRKPSPRSKSAENSTSAPCIHYACVVIKDDYWEVSESGNVVTRHHINDRDVLFDPCGTKCPYPTRMLSDTRRTRYDQEDYDGVRLVRSRKGSKRVPGYPSDLWNRLSLKERNRRWEEYQKKMEDKDKDKDDPKGTCAPQASVKGDCHEHFAAPAMPVEHCDYEPHRSNMRALVEDKLSEIQKKIDFDLFANVAKVLTKHEISKSPGAQKALDAEWEKLLNKKTWDPSRVKECRTIVEDAKRKGEKVHIGRIFEICTLKGSELPEGDPNRKHKGRTCFQGNNVFDESSDYAIFAEMSSSPASMEAAKILDAYGSQPRHSKEQADARQAYTQAIFTGIPTWLRLPRNRWPKDWQRLYKDPLVPMLLALYGHPDSGGIWEKHFEDRIATIVGYQC